LTDRRGLNADLTHHILTLDYCFQRRFDNILPDLPMGEGCQHSVLFAVETAYADHRTFGRLALDFMQGSKFLLKVEVDDQHLLEIIVPNFDCFVERGSYEFGLAFANVGLCYGYFLCMGLSGHLNDTILT
jgi:hypothetical protein